MSDEIQYTFKTYRLTWRILPGELEPDARPAPSQEIVRPKNGKLFVGSLDLIEAAKEMERILLAQ